MNDVTYLIIAAVVVTTIFFGFVILCALSCDTEARKESRAPKQERRQWSSLMPGAPH